MNGTFKRPPMIQHDKSPEEVVGLNNMGLLTEHYRRTMRCTTDEEHARALKGNKETGFLSRAECAHCAEMYEKLRNHGYYPSGLDQRGEIQFRVVAKSDLQLLMEKMMPLKTDIDPGAEYSRDEIAQFREIGRQCEAVFHEVPEVTPAEIAQEALP